MSKAEARLLPKLTATFMDMLSKPKAKSVEIELIRAVFSTKLSEDANLFGRAREALLDKFLKSKDPNLAYLGLDVFNLMLETLK